MNSSSRTKAASRAAQVLIEMGIDRRKIGHKKLLLLLGWCALNGQITEPEARILIGRAGALTKHSEQGYFRKYDLPPGLKAAHHFPHLHFFHLTEKGWMHLAAHNQELAQYGNLDLSQRVYLHDHIGRVEAAWRLRICAILGYIPESRLTGQSAPGLKQHDGVFVMPDGTRTGLEIEAADWKSGTKLAQFVTSCLNSITSGRVQRVQVLVQTQTAKRHYANAFLAGQSYHTEWVKENGRWWARQKTQTTISPELAAKVQIDLILSREQVEMKIAPQPTEWMPSAMMQFDDLN